MTSRGSAPSMTAVIAARASETTFEARSLIGISSIRIAGGISGRTSRMRRSSVGRIMVCVYAGQENNTPSHVQVDCRRVAVARLLLQLRRSSGHLLRVSAAQDGNGVERRPARGGRGVVR